MENTLIIVLAGIIAMMLILRFTPERKIVAMGDFFKKVLPRIPITDIVKAFRK